MKHEPSITPHDRRVPQAADFARAKAMFAAGQGVEHLVVGEWLLTWGDPDYKDFPEWLLSQNG